MDDELFNIYNDIGLPIVIAFVDLGLNSSHPNGSLTLNAGNTQSYKTIKDRHQAIEDSQDLVIKVLPKVASEVFKAFVVCYADVTKYGYVRMQFGVNHDSFPSLTVNVINTYTPYPSHLPMIEEDILNFL